MRDKITSPFDPQIQGTPLPPDQPVEQPGQAQQQRAQALKTQPSAVGFVGPGPQGNPATDEQPPLVIGSWQSFYENVFNDVTTGNFWRALRTKREFVNQADTSVPVLNEEDIKNLKEGRPGIVFPSDVRQTTAAAIVEDYDNDKHRRDILTTIQPTTSGKITGAAGTFIGSILGNPLQTAAEVALTDGIGLAEKLGLGRVAYAESLSRRAAINLARGSAEGLAFGGISAAGDDIKAIQNGEAIDIPANIHTIATNVALGGPLFLFGGLISDVFKKQKALMKNRRFFGNNGSDDTATSAANAMGQGQDPNIEMPLKNGVATQVALYHKDLKEQNVSPESMHNALDDAEKNIDLKTDALSKKMDEFGVRTKERPFTPDEQKEATGLGKELQELQLAAKSVESHRYMLNNEGLHVTPAEVQEYASKIDNPRFDYAQGRGQEDVPPQGAPVKDQKTNLEDQYPKEVQEQLLDGAPLTDEQKNELDNINESEERNRVFKKALATTIKCLVGS